jgi:hypothetical protein
MAYGLALDLQSQTPDSVVGQLVPGEQGFLSLFSC